MPPYYHYIFQNHFTLEDSKIQNHVLFFIWKWEYVSLVMIVTNIIQRVCFFVLWIYTQFIKWALKQ